MCPRILTSSWAGARRACPQACLQGSQTHSGRCALYTDYDSLLVCPTFPSVHLQRGCRPCVTCLSETQWRQCPREGLAQLTFSFDVLECAPSLNKDHCEPMFLVTTPGPTYEHCLWLGPEHWNAVPQKTKIKDSTQPEVSEFAL